MPDRLPILPADENSKQPLSRAHWSNHELCLCVDAESDTHLHVTMMMTRRMTISNSRGTHVIRTISKISAGEGEGGEGREGRWGEGREGERVEGRGRTDGGWNVN